MQRKSHVAVVALMAIAGVIGTARAGSEVPEVGPQWMHSYFRDAPADDELISLVDRTWTRLPDGDVVLFTRKDYLPYNASLLARRFSADGSLRKSRVVTLWDEESSSIDRTIAAYDPASGDVVLLAGYPPESGYVDQCRLLRLDANLELKSSTPLGEDTPHIKACIAMRIAADGSVIAADDAGLSRVDTNGNVLWSIRNGDAGRLLHPEDLVLDQAGVIWVASQGPLVGQQGAAVLRFDLDGTFLSSDYYLCDSCVASTARALDLQEDGRVYATGSSGFLARYAPSGDREFVADFASGGSGLHLDHDEQGAIYALVRTYGEPEREVRRLDPDNGAELWAQPADAFVATADGVVVTRRVMQDTFGAGYDATGAELWNRELEPAPGLVSDPQFVDGRVEMLAVSWPAEPDCGTAPRLVALDAGGSPEVLAWPCLMPTSTWIRSVDAKPALGVLANLSDRLIAYTPDDELLWQVGPCPWCLYTWWTHAVLTPDGGAWAVRLAGYTSYTAELVRFDNGGVEQFSVPLADPEWSSGMALFAVGKDAIVVQGISNDIVWHRVRSDTGMVETQFHSLPMLPFDLLSARRLEDGGVGLAVRMSDCGFLCPPRPPPYELLARLTSNGALAWSTPPAWNHGVTLFDDSGGASVVAGADDGYLHLQRVDPDGNTTADIALSDVIGGARGLFGPYAGRLLLTTGSSDAFRLWSIGADGGVLASRALAAGTSVRSDSPLGLLVWNRADSPSLTQWIDPVSLDTRANFRIPSAEPILSPPSSRTWQLLSDGSVYGSQRFRDSSGLALARLARFTAPGYTPTELIYRNGFD